MKRNLLLCSAAALLAWGCKDGGTAPSVATTVAVSPGAGSLNALGATQVVHATVTDQKGKPMPGATLAWSATTAGVTVAGAGGDSAIVTAVANGPVTVTATSGSASGSVAVTVAQAPAALQKVAGDGQTGGAGTGLVAPLQVAVKDRLGAPVAGVSVSFAVVGGGSVSTPASATGDNGIITVMWTLGPVPGSTQQVTASVPGVAPVQFTATAVTGPPVASVSAGNNQGAMTGTAVPTAPAVMVRTAAGTPVAGVAVTFAVTAGGGTVANPSAVTNASGVASAGSWVLGPVAGPNTLTATVDGITSPISFRGIGCTGGGAGYAMTLCFTSTMSASQRTVFQNAAARWATVITGDVSNELLETDVDDCGPNSPAVDMEVDDLVIFAGIQAIDGPGAVLGSAGPCYIRSPGNLPVAGLMRFDAADVADLEAAGQFSAVILHEMGHVLGIGTMWPTFELLQNASSSSTQRDTWFSGANGIAGFDAIGGILYTGGQKVPVENTGGAGTANGHWRESVLGRELMTGFLNSGVANPLSLLTVRSLTDMGYVVNTAAADAFTITPSLQGAGAAAPTGLRLHNDIYTGPLYSVDRQGRKTRVRN